MEKRYTECTIDVWSDNWGWCLECLANTENAEEILKQKQKEFPNKKFRIDYSDTGECWWHTCGTH